MKFAYANSMMEYSARFANFFMCLLCFGFAKLHFFFANDIEWLVCNNLPSLSLAKRKLW